MRRWSVEVRLEPKTTHPKHPLAWPVIEHKLFWTEVGAKKYAGYWAYNSRVHTRVTHLGRIS